MPRIAIGPFERFGGAVVVTDEAHQFARQVLDRAKDAAGDDVALDLGEPVLDLVEP